MPPGPPDNQPRATPIADHDDDEGADVPGGRHYTMRQAAAALGCHLVTLQRWLRLEGMKPQRQPGDRRKKWLTKAQVERLAQQHDRWPLRPVQDDTEQRLRDLERRIEELEDALERMQDTLQRPPERPPLPEYPYEPPAPRPRAATRTRPLGATTILDPVPEDWVPLSVFAERISVPRRTFISAVRRGRLSSHRGEWQTVGPNPVRTTELLDPDEQEAARRYFGR